MKEYKLSELFSLQMGKTPARDNYTYWSDAENPWVSIADISLSDKYINVTKECISDAAIRDTNIRCIPQNTVLMSFKLSIGKTAITSRPMYTNEAIMAFIPKSDTSVLPEYLYYLLLQKEWNTKGNKAVKGITLNKSSLSNVKIRLHPVDKQNEIASNLNRVTGVIRYRQQQLRKLDELVKCRFVEMFGDPVLNPLSWVKNSLGKLGSLGRGVSKHRPRNAAILLNGSHPLIQTGDVAASNIYIEKYLSTYSDYGLQQSKKWPENTLCITIAANIAKTAILKFDSCFPDSVVGFISGKKTHQIFIHVWFSFFQSILEAQAPQSAQKNLNLKALKRLQVITPPIHLQNKFATFVQQLDKSRFAIQRSLEETQKLFDSLMQEYFS